MQDKCKRDERTNVREDASTKRCAGLEVTRINWSTLSYYAAVELILLRLGKYIKYIVCFALKYV